MHTRGNVVHPRLQDQARNLGRTDRMVLVLQIERHVPRPNGDVGRIVQRCLQGDQQVALVAMLHVQIGCYNRPRIQVLQAVQRGSHAEWNIADGDHTRCCPRHGIGASMQLERDALLRSCVGQEARELTVLVPVRCHRHITELECQNALLYVRHRRRHGDVEDGQVGALVALDKPTACLSDVDWEAKWYLERRLGVGRARRGSPSRFRCEHQGQLVQFNCLDDTEVTGGEVR